MGVGKSTRMNAVLERFDGRRVARKGGLVVRVEGERGKRSRWGGESTRGL